MVTTPQSTVPVTPPAKGRLADNVCPTCGQTVSHLKFQEIRAKEHLKERERATEFHRQLEEAAAAARAVAQADTRAAVAKVKSEATAREAKVRERAKKETEAALAPRIAAAEKELTAVKASRNKEEKELRAALEKERDHAVNKEKADAFRANQRLRGKVASLQRQLEHKTADDLGEGAEVDLLDALKSEFRGDKIWRLKRGEAGADIVHEVVENGRVCGRILYDSKNRDAWRNEHVTKLRADQLAYPADHSVLSTRVFPAGSRQLDVRSGVVMAHPARVVAVVQVLRASIFRADSLRLSAEARDEKASEVYAFITSHKFGQILDQIQDNVDAAKALDVKEKTVHDKTWSDRGQLLRSAERARASLDFEIGRIIGTAAEKRSA